MIKWSDAKSDPKYVFGAMLFLASIVFLDSIVVHGNSRHATINSNKQIVKTKTSIENLEIFHNDIAVAFNVVIDNVRQQREILEAHSVMLDQLMRLLDGHTKEIHYGRN